MLAFDLLVVGIEHLGNVFRRHLAVDGPVVVAHVKGLEIKGFYRLGLPQPQGVDGVDPIAGDRGVVGDALYLLSRNPALAETAIGIDIALAVATKAHGNGRFGVGNFPGVAVLQPFIGNFYLPAIADLLVENAKLVANAVANGGNLQTGHRLHIASRQPP